MKIERNVEARFRPCVGRALAEVEVVVREEEEGMLSGEEWVDMCRGREAERADVGLEDPALGIRVMSPPLP